MRLLWYCNKYTFLLEILRGTLMYDYHKQRTFHVLFFGGGGYIPVQYLICNMWCFPDFIYLRDEIFIVVKRIKKLHNKWHMTLICQTTNRCSNWHWRKILHSNQADRYFCYRIFKHVILAISDVWESLRFLIYNKILKIMIFTYSLGRGFKYGLT